MKISLVRLMAVIVAAAALLVSTRVVVGQTSEHDRAYSFVVGNGLHMNMDQTVSLTIRSTSTFRAIRRACGHDLAEVFLQEELPGAHERHGAVWARAMAQTYFDLLGIEAIDRYAAMPARDRSIQLYKRILQRGAIRQIDTAMRPLLQKVSADVLTRILNRSEQEC